MQDTLSDLINLQVAYSILAKILSRCKILSRTPDLHPPTLAEDREELVSTRLFFFPFFCFPFFLLKELDSAVWGEAHHQLWPAHGGHWPGEVKGSRATSTCSCCPGLPETLCSSSGDERSTLLPKIQDREFLMVFHIMLSQLFTEHIFNFFVLYKKADGFADINTKLVGSKMQLMHF